MRMRAAMSFFMVAAVLAAGVLAGGVAPVLAETTAASQPDWDQETDQVLTAVKAQYGLADDQVEKIRPLLRDHLASMRSVFDSYVGQSIDAAPAILKQYQDLRADFKAKVDPILTESQRKDFMAIRAEFDKQMRKAVVDARMQWFGRVIGIDATQAEKVRPIVAESLEKRLQALTTTPETKDPEEARKAIRIRLQILQGETNTRLREVLTPEQMSKYQDSAGTGAPAKAEASPGH